MSVRPAFILPDGFAAGLYRALLARYGQQPWWPADSPFEIAVGAVLTQNAAWANVERAIERLKSAGLLHLEAILSVDHDTLAETIRPSGYFNIKARRLRNLCLFLDREGGLEGLGRRDLEAQRRGLLSVNGVGPETADDILLYAQQQPVFVIDSYTRRLLQRHALADGGESYDQLRSAFELSLGADVCLFQQFHALIVLHAKESCRKQPRCADCALLQTCPGGSVATPGLSAR